MPPNFYPAGEIEAFLQAASQLRLTNGLRSQTYVTLFVLLINTGLRISEVLNLSRQDADLRTGILTILVPVHSSTLHALKRYSKFRSSSLSGTKSKIFFLYEKGTPLNYRGMLYIFLKPSHKLNCRDREKKPRIHDFRHTFAVRRLLKWYE